MESLAKLLAYAVGGDPDHYDELDARIHLLGFARVIQDEDLVVEIAKRLHASKSLLLWDDAHSDIRNMYIMEALNVLDALRDLITEELAR
jgi:hypothetical protein